MKNSYFDRVLIGGKEVSFKQRLIQGRFRIFVPEDFFEDKNIVSKYTYLFSQDKSPLSIAIKYTALADAAGRRKMTGHYFSRSGGNEKVPVEQLAEGIHYRETVTGGKYLSIYSLRFTVDVGDGVLSGCFNCSADYKDDWRETVLEMIRSVEIV